MKKFLIFLAFSFIGVVAFAQRPTETNFREGDFSTKEVKAKTLNIGNVWTFGKNSSTGALEWKYGTTTVYSISTSGAPSLSGAVSGTTGTFTGALEAATLNTGQGANELYDMDQNVMTTSAVTFTTVNTGNGAYELYNMNQDVTTTSAVTFASAVAGTATITTAGVTGVLTTPKVKQTATDTAGVGSTANIGMMMYFNGHFYGLKAGEPPTWVQLDN